MRSRRLLVFVLLALAGLGWAATHALAHRLMAPEALAGGMPGAGSYLGYLPVSFALCMALALPLAAGIVSWRRTSVRSLWFFGVVPVLGYVGHALVEPLIAGSTTFYATSAAAVHLLPIALVGLLVQIPFALAAVALGRGLFALAETVARWLVGHRIAVGPRTADRPRPAPAARRPAFRLDLDHSQRAPPSPVLA